MTLLRIYDIGKQLPLTTNVASIDKKLAFVLFPYDSRAVINTALACLVVFLVGSVVTLPLAPFLSYILGFFGVILAVLAYLYPTGIFYSQRLGEYNEEMLRAILRLSTFVSMDSSLEYAFFESAEHLHGTLKLQFLDIKHMLQRKEATTLGGAIDKYVDVWNEINPTFVKSLRLLQTAGLSKKEERDTILRETTETLLLNYTTLGKRFAEELTNNAKKLVSLGVLFPVMSLMLLPLLAVFMPDFVQPPLLAFIYVILFPSVMLLMALNFASKRIQVDTVRIREAEVYKSLPRSVIYIGIAVAIFLAIPTLLYLAAVMAGGAPPESLWGLFMGWLMGAGIVLGVFIYSFIYVARYKKLWNEVHEIEQDLPHLLQSFSTYLTLNISTENVIPEVVNDYIRFGFAKHPVVTAFKKLHRLLLTSKQDIETIVNKKLKSFLPSRKVVQIISQIISFSKISQQSSARVTKMIREQTIGVYKLDDYMKTLLAESVGLINVTTSLLAPLLCASAVIMSMAIVKSLVYITDQLKVIANAFGAGAGLSFNLVDTSAIIPPVFIEVIVGLYLIETIFILSLFGTTISVGNDWFKFFEALKKNAGGFLIYTAILFGGYYFVVQVFFQSVLGVG